MCWRVQKAEFKNHEFHIRAVEYQFYIFAHKESFCTQDLQVRDVCLQNTSM